MIKYALMTYKQPKRLPHVLTYLIQRLKYKDNTRYRSHKSLKITFDSLIFLYIRPCLSVCLSHMALFAMGDFSYDLMDHLYIMYTLSMPEMNYNCILLVHQLMQILYKNSCNYPSAVCTNCFYPGGGGCYKKEVCKS